MKSSTTTASGIGALGTLMAFILFLVFLGILWATTGGPERPITHAGPFLKPPKAPSVNRDVGSVQGSTFEADPTQIGGVRAEGETLLNYFFNSSRSGDAGGELNSPYAKSIRVSRGSSTATDPNQEYILIETLSDLTQNITITGWTLESRTTGIKAPVVSAAQIPLLGGISSELPVTVGPNARVYITTGRSPIGSSFRLNMCAGYLEQHQNFSPGIDRNCPDPEEEALRNPQKTGTNIACIDFVDRLNACEIFTGTIPSDVGSQCRDFILNDLTYNGCAAAHRNDPGFYKNEWRLFLNRQQELWSNTHEQIRLLDENGKVVSSITY